MKKSIVWVLICLLLLFVLGCGAKQEEQKEEPVSPLLWKVTDGDGHTMYLFGTIHVGDERSNAVLEKLSPVLESCDALAVEFDVVAYENDLAAAAQDMLRFMLTDGTTIEDHMPAELYERAYTLLDEAGLYPGMMKYYNLQMWAQLVETAAITTHSDLDAEHAMDSLLINCAYEKKIPVWDVESASYQMELLNSLSDEACLLQIQTTLDSLGAYRVSLNIMYRLWLSGDRDAFWKLVAAETDGTIDDPAAADMADFNAVLIDERNLAMAEKAKEFMETGKTVFFAVGAAHMANETGIVALLTAAGYTVEEINVTP